MQTAVQQWLVSLCIHVGGLWMSVALCPGTDASTVVYAPLVECFRCQSIPLIPECPVTLCKWSYVEEGLRSATMRRVSWRSVCNLLALVSKTFHRSTDRVKFTNSEVYPSKHDNVFELPNDTISIDLLMAAHETRKPWIQNRQL